MPKHGSRRRIEKWYTMNLYYAYGSALKSSHRNKSAELFREIFNIDADGWLVDRTQTVNFPFSEQLADAYLLPEFTKSVTFKDACLQYAAELYAEGKHIYIMWSGGIDSTAIVTAFLMLNVDLSRITIVLNQDSIREYPKFYKDHIRGRFKIVVTEELMMNISSVKPFDGIVLSGEHADQLVGANTVNSIMRSLGPDYMKETLNADSFEKLFSSKGTQQGIACWFNIYRQTFTKAPRPIETVYDFAWWHNFNFRWQSIGMKLYTRISKDTDFRTFYSGLPFQQWSVFHQPNLNDLDTLKQEPKQFIFEYTKDQSYFDYKIKHPSTTLYYSRPSAAAVDTDMNKISYSNFNLSNHLRLDNSIAVWLNNQ
jgi:hypothetical protein